jgi:hypothetical protein
MIMYIVINDHVLNNHVYSNQMIISTIMLTQSHTLTITHTHTHSHNHNHTHLKLTTVGNDNGTTGFSTVRTVGFNFLEDVESFDNVTENHVFSI